MKTVLIHLPHTPPVIAEVIGDEENTLDYITVDHPVMMLDDNNSIYTTQYMPFAKDNLVMIYKKNIISMASPDDALVKHYNEVVESFKKKKKVYKEVEEKDFEAASKFMRNLKSKILH